MPGLSLRTIEHTEEVYFNAMQQRGFTFKVARGVGHYYGEKTARERERERQRQREKDKRRHCFGYIYHTHHTDNTHKAQTSV